MQKSAMFFKTSPSSEIVNLSSNSLYKGVWDVGKISDGAALISKFVSKSRNWTSRIGAAQENWESGAGGRLTAGSSVCSGGVAEHPPSRVRSAAGGAFAGPV